MTVHFEESSPALVSIDLSWVFSQLRNIRERKTVAPSLQTDGPIGNSRIESGEPRRAQALSLVPARSEGVQVQGTTLLPPRALRLRPLGQQPYPPKLRPLRTVMYRVLVSSPDRGAVKDFEFEVPLGLPRRISAATLKAMVGTGRHDVLLRKVGERWEICPDTFPIDLQNRSEVFRIGPVQVYS